MSFFTRLRRRAAQQPAATEDDITADGRTEPVPGHAATGDAANRDADDGAAGDRTAGPPRGGGTTDGAAGRRAGRPVARWAATTVACLLVLFALIVPNEVGRLTPGAFVRIPLEAVIGVALALVLPARPRRVVAVLVGVTLGVLAIVKVIDMGFSAVLARPFDLVFDWTFFGPAVEFLTESMGRAGAIGSVVAIAIVAIAVLASMTWSVLRLTRLVVRHDTTATRAAAVLGVAWIVCAMLGAQIVPDTPVAAHAYDRLFQVRESLQDQQAFAKESAVDAFGDTPGAELLTALRGKDVVVAFVESYGRDAIEDPNFAPQVGAVLDAGNQRLRAAGFSARSGFLTSSTSGGGSWLAHATLLSGLWVDNQQRHRTLVESDRLTLNGAFRRAGWRTVGVMPGVTRAWPEGRFYGFDRLYDRWTMGYQGPRFNWGTPPDQYTLSAFERYERAKPGHTPVMAEIPLVTSHAPWSPTPRLIDWDDVGDGSVFNGMPAAGGRPEGGWGDPTRVRADYRRSIEYSLNSVISYVETHGDDDLVLVFLGDHQPTPLVTGKGADRDVPITIVARDRAVVDRISGWGWHDGLKPGPQAPVWRMNTFRDRFLTAFGSRPALPAPSTRSSAPKAR